jgi:ABC-2 type transport system ATP-binding protein
MSYINVDGISKTFKVAKRNSGLKAALKSFFKREYVSIDAVKDISFQIEKGEIVGYIGPNGAGKSTTIKMLSGILLPTAGSIKVNNLDPFKDRKKYVSKIGVVFGQRSQLAWDIPAEDTFDLLKDIYRLEDKEYQKTKQELIELLNISQIIKKPVRSLSLGERMRCEIAASLLHRPNILFLDEPTIGLDAVSKKVIRDFILKLNKERKVTVILTTHDMQDIASLAKRIILIGKGQILYDGSS